MVVGLGARSPTSSVGHREHVTASEMHGGKLRGVMNLAGVLSPGELSKRAFLSSLCALPPHRLQTCRCQSFCSLKVQLLIVSGGPKFIFGRR